MTARPNVVGDVVVVVPAVVVVAADASGLLDDEQPATAPTASPTARMRAAPCFTPPDAIAGRSRPQRERELRRRAAVDHDGLARDVRRQIRREERNGLRDVVGCREPSERYR